MTRCERKQTKAHFALTRRAEPTGNVQEGEAV